MKNTIVSLFTKSSNQVTKKISKIVGVFFFMLTMLFSNSTFAQSTTQKATITLEEIGLLSLGAITVFIAILLVMAAFTIYSNSRTMFNKK
jgi:preprotein translocase subunit SecG